MLQGHAPEAAAEEAVATFEAPLAAAGQNDADGGVEEGSSRHLTGGGRGREGYTGSGICLKRRGSGQIGSVGVEFRVQMQRRSRRLGQIESVHHLLMAVQFVAVLRRVVASIAWINVESGRMRIDLVIEEKARFGG